MKVRLKDLTVDPAVRIREKLDEETIERYEEILDTLPPVIAFKTPEGMVLADGYHRWAAAERLGHQTISADVRQGSRTDALEYSISANTSHGRSLTRTEYRSAVRRLRQIHPKWTDAHVAKVINRGEAFVRFIREADEVRREVVIPTSASDSHLAEIKSADRSLWPDLVKATEERGWSHNEIRDVVRELKDESSPPERKQALLSGKAEPLTEKGGEPAVRVKRWNASRRKQRVRALA